ncbi:MAG: SDR family NAD(P)-dependent oxidoreductase, partial [Bdellovibrionales bacterium]
RLDALVNNAGVADFGPIEEHDQSKWRRVMEDNQRALYSQIEKTQSMQEEMDKRIDSVETTSGSVAIRFDDVLSEQKRLSYRLDTAVEDKTRLLKKMANLEDALTQTQDTLRARSLAMLTDQVSTPTTPSTLGAPKREEPLFIQTKEEKQNNQYVHPERKRAESKTKFGYYAVAASVVAILAVSGVLVVQKSNTTTQPTFQTPQLSSFERSVPTPSTLDAVDMTSLATKMNAIEPGSLSQVAEQTVTETEQAPLETQANKTQPAEATPSQPQEVASVKTSLKSSILKQEEQAVERLINNVQRGDLQKIIGTDGALPASIKPVEEEALKDNGAAQHDLAAIYTAGHGGVTTNFEKAAKWFEQAAYNGIANARYNLGVLYHQGLGVQKNEQYAIDLYRAAAHVNHPEAQYNLGIAYIEGVGVSQDVARAAHYFEEAATNNVMEAAYNLGLIYENGLLGEQQPDEALFWYKVASSKGSLEGRQALESLAKKLELAPADVESLISRIAVLKPDVKMVLGARSQNIAEDVTPVSTEVVYTEPAAGNTANTTIVNTAPGSDAVIVAQIQEQLIDLGLYPGPADGIVGPVTQDAVRAYQKLNGLQVDGDASEDILVHMLAREFELNTYPASGLFEDVGSQE